MRNAAALTPHDVDQLRRAAAIAAGDTPCPHTGGRGREALTDRVLCCDCGAELEPLPAGTHRGVTYCVEVIDLPESRSWHGLASAKLPAAWQRPSEPVDVGQFCPGLVGQAIVRAAEFEDGRWTVDLEAVCGKRLWREKLTSERARL